MSHSLDISLHGAQRVEIIERLVHICRYSPGLVYLDGEPGKSPVSFLEHMADLLRDELDFSLLDPALTDMTQICAALMSQWFVYRSDDGQTDVQRIHHFLDVGAQGGRLALVVVLRTTALQDDAINFLIGLMARHSKLTVLFSGVSDTRPLFRRAQQAEVPIHRIELPESSTGARAQQDIPVATPSAPRMDHTFADAFSKALETDDDLFGDTGHDGEMTFAASRGDAISGRRRQSSVGAASGHRPANPRVEPALGVSTRLSAMHSWGAATFANFRRRRAGLPLLMVAGAALLALLLVAAMYRADNGRISSPTAAMISPPAEGLPSSSGVPPPVIGLASGRSGGNVETVSPSVPVQAPSVPQPVSDSKGLVAAVAPVEVNERDGVGQPNPKVQAAPDPVEQISTADGAHTAPAGVEAAPAKASVIPKDPVVDRGKTAAAPPSSSTGVQSSSERQWRAKPQHYTVQLAAARGEKSVRALAASLPTKQPHFVYSTTRDGKPWFVLVYGSFPRREAAVAAKDELARLLKSDSSPWVRKQGEVFR